METSEYTVKTNIFEGPLDLLLSLVEKRKLFVNDLSLSKVADDFIAHINSIESFPIDESANFILTASTLLLIKSRSLLPTLDLTGEEEQSIEELQDRLKIYQDIKHLSEYLKERFGVQVMFEKRGRGEIPVVFSPDQTVTAKGLFEAIERTLSKIPKKEILPKATVRKVISLEETILRLTKRVQNQLSMRFSDVYGKKKTMSREEKVDLVVGFLAVLELVKQGIVMVKQESIFEEIEIEHQQVNTPSYGA